MKTTAIFLTGLSAGIGITWFVMEFFFVRPLIRAAEDLIRELRDKIKERP